MSSRFSTLIGAALLLVACGRSESSTTGPDNAPQNRTLSGSCELTIEPISSNPPIVRQRDFGTCQLSPLGPMQFDGVLDINVAQGTQVGTRTFTASNGDQLRATVTGSSSPTGPGLISFSATFTFTGGTGRFANATGAAQGTGVANQMARTSTVSLSGTVRY